MDRSSKHDQIQPAYSLTAGERELLQLLASGATHETVAHRLNIPLRTVRRRIAGLMKQLGAISQFQAGAEAAWRGWLVAPGPRGDGAGHRENRNAP